MQSLKDLALMVSNKKPFFSLKKENMSITSLEHVWKKEEKKVYLWSAWRDQQSHKVAT